MNDPHCQHNDKRIEELVKDMAAAKMEHQSFKRRIDELEGSSKRQNDILVTLQRQADAIQTMNEKIDDVASDVKGVAKRVEAIENEPADKWKKMSFEAIKYIVLAVLGAIAGYFLNGA